MDVISKLADIDPVFREVAATLYPDIDARELYQLAKAAPGTADVHVNAAGDRRKKMGLAAGLGAGVGIEALAAKETIHPLMHDIKAARPAMKGASIGGKLKALRALGPGKGRIGSGTKAALMVGNLAVGLGAAKELAKKPKPAGVAKAAQAAEHLAPELMGAFEDILAARRRGEIDTPTALQLIDQVAPKELVAKGAAKSVARVIAGTVPAPGKFARLGDQAAGVQRVTVANHAKTAGYEWEKAISRGRMAAGAATFTGAGALAYKHRSRKLRRPIGKSEDAPVDTTERIADPQLTWDGEITKVNDERRQVFGWCSLSTVNGEPVVDLQEDHVPIEEIEKSAYKYVITSRKGGDMHKRVGKGIYAQDEPLHTADLIESVIITPEKLAAMGVPSDAVSKVHTGWWVGFQVNDDEQWQKVKNGERAGFSIHGTGTRKMVNS